MNKLQVKFDSATRMNPALIESVSGVQGLGATVVDGGDSWNWQEFFDNARNVVNEGVKIYTDARNQITRPAASAAPDRASATPSPAPSWIPGVSNSVVVVGAVGLLGAFLLIRKR